MRGLTGGLSEVQADGATVGDVIDALETAYPGLKARLLAGDRLKPNIALVVDGVNSKQGLRHPVTSASEVHFVPAISGGNSDATPIPPLASDTSGTIDTAETIDTSEATVLPPTTPQRLRAVVLFLLAVVISVGVLALSSQFRDVLIAFGQLGLVGLFVLSVLGNATVVVPAPAFVVACAAGPIYGALATGLVAGLGAGVGEMTGYMAGYGSTAVLSQGRLYQRMHQLIQRYGALVIFIMAALPNPLFDMGGLIAGALKMPPWLFFISTATGKAVRLTLVAFVCVGGLPWLSGVFRLPPGP